MNQDLLRQRRNLIAVSAVLLLFDFADVRITKVGVLGTDLLVGNVEVLMVCAWLLWAYFLLRYYQYWRAEEKQPMRRALWQQFRRMKDAYWKKRYAEKYPYVEGQVADFERKEFLTYGYSFKTYDPQNTRSISLLQFEPIAVWRYIAWRVLTFLHVVVQTHHATDHMLPFVIAIAAPIVTFAPPFVEYLSVRSA